MPFLWDACCARSLASIRRPKQPLPDKLEQRKGLTRRQASAAALSVAVAPMTPGIIRSTMARPTQGVTFVEANSGEAERLAFQYNLTYSQPPRLRAVCETSDAVAHTLRWARETNTSFAIRSGGHCYGGTSSHPDLVIDLRALNAVSVDATSRIATAQSGTKLNALYRAGFPHALAPAAGWCGDVGVGGHVLGGGLGYLARANGLLCDHLKSLTLIDAQGEARRCSSQENPDLYWASRGGGGGFGIATEFNIDLQPVEDMHALRLFGGIEPSDMPAFVERWMRWSGNAPRATSSQLAVATMTDGRLFARVTGLSSEPRETVFRALRGVSGGLLPVDEQTLISGSFERVMEDAVLSIPHFYLHSASHTAVWNNALSATDLSPILEAIVASRRETGSVSLLIEAMGGALADTPSDATAFPHRDGAFLATASYGTVSQELLEAARPDLDDVGQKLWQHAVAKGYANYRDRSLEDFENAYWGENVTRLRAIKRRFDPDGIFTGVQTITC